MRMQEHSDVVLTRQTERILVRSGDRRLFIDRPAHEDCACKVGLPVSNHAFHSWDNSNLHSIFRLITAIDFISREITSRLSTLTFNLWKHWFVCSGTLGLLILYLEANMWYVKSTIISCLSSIVLTLRLMNTSIALFLSFRSIRAWY